MSVDPTEPLPPATGAAPDPRGERPRRTPRRSMLVRALIVLLCAGAGFAVVAQAQQDENDSLRALRQDDLVQLLDELTRRNDDLAAEGERLRLELADLRTRSTSRQSAQEAAEQQARTYGVLAGTLPARGPGIELRIDDPDAEVPAHTFVTVLEELRNAGAEVIELNGVRVVAQTWIVDGDGGIVVDGEQLSSPYVWRAIGDPDALAPALEIAGGALASVRSNGGDADVIEREELQIVAVRTPTEPRYAEPVDPEDVEDG